MKSHFFKETQDLSLLDEDFLAALLEQKERTVYARIAALDINELPLDTIEGRVTGGSLNIDGASSVRRTCSLTMISDEIDINDFYWGLKTKFKLEIGIVNSLSNEYSYIDNDLYPEIVWFQEGIFLVTSFNTSITTSNCTISLQGKDKMCLLNGDLGGQLFASIDFGQEEIKTAKMTQAAVEINNSDVLMAEEYYIRPTDGPDNVSALDNDIYIFITDSTGMYCKRHNEYIKGSIVNQTFYIENNIRYVGQRYTLFQKVMSPNDLFESIEFDNNEPIPKNQYYYKKYDDYYVVNTTTRRSGTGDYQLTQLYLLDYEYTIKKIPLEKIIRESVHAYAKEPYHNIIINDLDTYGLEQLTYRGDEPLYALRNLSTGHFTQMFMKGQNESLDRRIQENIFDFDPLVSETTRVIGTVLKLSNREFTIASTEEINSTDPDIKKTLYTVAKFEYGADIGYRITDLTYTGDLVTSIGDTLVTMLDKIKNMLGDFEYFYDTTGHFIFQRKKTYVNTSWSLLTKTDDETFVNYVNSDHNKFSFNFEGNRLLTAVQNAPALNNLRNDFSVWGKRKSVSGADIPIHARYAIDKKPKFYHSITDKIYLTEDWLENNQNSPLLEELSQEENTYTPFEKAPVPDCLKNQDGTSDWWEVSNWGRWYELQIGAPPSGRMMSYQTGEEGFKGVITFPNGTILDCTNSWKGQLMIDLDESGNPYQNAMIPEEVREDGTIIRSRPYGSYRQHGWGGCGHNFLLVIKVNQANPGMKSYIYKPVLPDLQTQQQDIEQAGENPLTTNDLEGKRIYIVDWREIIYQMALDYFAGQGCSKENPIYNINNEIVMDDPDHLLPIIAANNPDYYPTGYTGYEQYYTDMQGFWRELYNPEYHPKEIWSRGEYVNIRNTDVSASSSVFFTRRKQWQQSEISDYEIQYYVSLENSYVQEQYQNLLTRLTEAAGDSTKQEEIRKQIIKFCKYCFQTTDNPVSNNEFPFETDKKKMYWNIDVFENPEKLNFWIEFLDSPTELAEFSIPVVGDRSKTINADKASAIVFKEIPDLILLDRFEKDQDGNDTFSLDLGKLRNEIEDQSGYTFIYLPKGFSQYLTISYRSISVKNKIDELLYQFGYCIENISITALPIYHLQPNTRIYVQDKTTQINGEYIVNKITIPLTYNGTMSINANKAPERFY